jgi:hypothetical protein
MLLRASAPPADIHRALLKASSRSCSSLFIGITLSRSASEAESPSKK